jgi:hypothetical protein
MFTDENVRLIAAHATKNGIEPAALLAIVECETAGDYMESDGRTPKFLYERHIAYREAQMCSTSLLTLFVKKGLAIPKWSRSTQYKDQARSKDRLALIANARAIDEEVANRSASWGLGQTMGNECRNVGYPTATALVNALVAGGLEAQIEAMIAEIKSKRLVQPLNDHDFVTVARRYNGAAYKANAYDTRMTASWRKWSRALDRIVAREVPPPEQALTKDQIKAVQIKLAGLGYKVVGKPDGKWGINTTAAMSAYQTNEGLVVTGHFDDESRAAFNTAEAKPIAQERLDTTAEDLRPNSRTIQAADKLGVAATIKRWTGGALVVGGGAQQLGLLDAAQSTVDKVGQAKGIWETVHGWVEPFISSPMVIVFGIGLVVVGYYVAKFSEHVIEARVDDHRTEAHTGNDA